MRWTKLAAPTAVHFECMLDLRNLCHVVLCKPIPTLRQARSLARLENTHAKIWFNNSIFGCLKALKRPTVSDGLYLIIWKFSKRGLLQSSKAEKAFSSSDQGICHWTTLGQSPQTPTVGSRYRAHPDPASSFLKCWLWPCCNGRKLWLRYNLFAVTTIMCSIL